MATFKVPVTKVARTTEDGKSLTSVRLWLQGRSFWLALTGMKTAKLNDKETEIELDDTEFNTSTYEVLQAYNEHGKFLKLMPKCTFKEAAF